MVMLSNKRLGMAVIIGFVLLVAAIVHITVDRSQPKDRTVRISYRVTVQNPTNQVIHNAAIHLRGPLAKTSYQQCAPLDAEPPPTEHTKQADHHAYLFKWDAFEPYTTKIVTLRGNIDLWKNPQIMPINDADHFLYPEPYIEADHPLVKQRAAELKVASSLSTVKNIYDWVSERIVYSGYIKRNRGALYALKHGKGDCTEYSCLFVALCRACGIPARMIGGYVVQNSAVLDLGDYHNWAQFYHNGQWHLADAQRRRFMIEQDTYIAFDIVEPSNTDEGAIVAHIQGKGLKVMLH